LQNVEETTSINEAPEAEMQEEESLEMTIDEEEEKLLHDDETDLKTTDG
jgi:hypothetical protein